MEPLHDGGEVDEPQEISIQFFVAGGEPSKNLHALEEVFYEMASFVALFVQGAWMLAIRFAGNDHSHALALCSAHDFIGVIGFVGDERPGGNALEQFSCRLAVVSLTRRQYKPHRVAMGVTQGMNFGIQAATGDANGLLASNYSAPPCPRSRSRLICR